MILLLLALFTFPIAVYCTILGMINRRTRPLMVSGVWDFLGVLFATSGLLLFLGPALLSGGFRASLQELPFQRGLELSEAVYNIWASWWVVWLLYYAVVLGGAVYLSWIRRNTTVVYNIDPQVLEIVLAQLVERLALRANRLGNRLFLSVGMAPVPLAGSADNAAPSSHVSASPLGAAPTMRSVETASEQVVVDVEPFEMLSNVSLHWRSASPAARVTLERELRQTLAEVLTLENAAGTWLLGIATLLFFLILLLTTVFVVAVFRKAI